MPTIGDRKKKKRERDEALAVVILVIQSFTLIFVYILKNRKQIRKYVVLVNLVSF